MKKIYLEKRQGNDRRQEKRHYFSLAVGSRREGDLVPEKIDVPWKEISAYWPQAV